MEAYLEAEAHFLPLGALGQKLLRLNRWDLQVRRRSSHLCAQQHSWRLLHSVQ